MSGRNPKEGVGYELSVATLLKISIFPDSIGTALDLRNFAFNIKPRKRKGESTGAGYPIELDITATSEDTKFHIECKKTNDTENIMRSNSEEFCKAMMEFLGTELKAQQDDITHRYLLVTNYNLGQDIRSLFDQPSPARIKKLKKLIEGYAEKILDESLNLKVASQNNLTRTLRKMRLLKITYPEIIAKSKDQEFKEQLAEFATKLNPFFKVIFGLDGPQIISSERKLIFNCVRKDDHIHCENVVVDGINCHFGDFTIFIEKILGYDYTSPPHFQKFSCKMLGFGPKDLSRGSLGVDYAADLLTRATNQLLHDRDFGVLFVRGTLDVIIFHKTKLAETIKNCINERGIYDLESIRSFKGMGLIKRDLSKAVLAAAYHFRTNDEDYKASEDIRSQLS